MMKHLIGPCKNEDGVTAIKYSLIALLFIIAAASAITGTGESLVAIWQNITSMTVVSG